MKILISGCSFSRGPISWPVHIAQYFDAKITNLAQSGAGNTYIGQSILFELQERQYDLVLIMWSGPERVDMQVSNIDLFDHTVYTSKFQSRQNDWPEKIIYPVNDQDYVQKDWVFGCGHINNDRELLKTGLFDKIYKYQSFDQHMQQSVYNMLAIESFLKVKSIPYLFSFYKKYPTSANKYLDLLDHCNIFKDINLYDLAKSMNNFDIDGLHPGPLAQNLWAKSLFEFILKSKIIR